MTGTPKGRAAAGEGIAEPKKAPTTFAEAYAALKPQYQKFVSAYLECPQTSRAAIEAGYAKSSAKNQGYRLLKLDEIKLAIQLGWAEIGMGPEEVRARTEQVARVSIEDFYSYDQVLERPYLWRPVRELLEELFAEIAFEEQFAQRANLQKDELKKHAGGQLNRRRQAVRMELEMERDPEAVRWAQGPPVLREVPRLDLAKARDLGVLYLAKGMEPTKHGLALKLQDPERARELIGKLHGLWGKDEHGGSGAEGLPDGTGLEDATDEQLGSELARLLGADAT